MTPQAGDQFGISSTNNSKFSFYGARRAASNVYKEAHTEGKKHIYWTEDAVKNFRER